MGNEVKNIRMFLRPGTGIRIVCILTLLLGLSACVRRVPGQEIIGEASYYSSDYHGNQTASGERYNMFRYTAAHPTLPFGSKVRVTNLENNRKVVVRINDRGPFAKNRIIDLSYAAARKIRMVQNGITRVRLEVLN